jgi:NADH-quinone oxidoreductase subunit N
VNPISLFPPVEINWEILLPVLIVAFTGILALIWEIAQPKRENGPIIVLSLGGLVVAGAALVMQLGSPDFKTAGDMFQRDALAVLLQLVMVLGAAITILFSEGYLRSKRIPFGEFYPLVMWSAAGGMIMVSSTNMLMIFLGLEALSIALYVLAGLSRTEERSEESALKYFLLGAFASGFLLYGMAFIYGATGSLDLDTIRGTWLIGEGATRPLLLFGLGLILIGLCFKASFVPFHQWTPDVYQGAPTNVTAFMSTVSKVAAFGALWRVLDASLPMKDLWIPALAVIAALTMTVGNLLALVQKDVKRILGYSSIAHAGYLLVGALAHFQRPDMISPAAVSFYLFSYLLMTAGAFAVISLAATPGKTVVTLEDLGGLYQRAPVAAVSMVVFVASLIGIPPLAGFWGKFAIFRDALQANLGWLAILLAVNSVLSLAYYLALGKAAFVTDPDAKAPQLRKDWGLSSACLVCAAGTVGLMLVYSNIADAFR